MLKYKKHIVVTIVFLGIVLLFLNYKYNEATPDTSFLKTEVELDATSFLELVNSTNDSISKDLIEKTIEVEGAITKIVLRDGVESILLSAGNNKNIVVCQMQENQKKTTSQMKLGDTIVVKGIYKGVLIDAILLHCIVKKK